MIALVAGAIVLSVPAGADFGSPWPALAIVAACLCWGLDNNLTRQDALTDATWLAPAKGAIPGHPNAGRAFLPGAHPPSARSHAGARFIRLFPHGGDPATFIL